MSNNHSGGFANPLPAGLVALGLACIIFFALLTGKVSHGALPVAGIWLLGGFAVQVIVAVIELREGSLGGGNVFLFFSAYFMLATGMVFILEYFAGSKGLHLDASVEGWCWIGLSMTMLLWTPAFLKTMPLYMAVAILVLDAASLLLTPMKLGMIPAAVYSPIIGWLILIAGLLGLFTAACIVVNGTFGREVFPCPGPVLRSRSANQQSIGG